MKSNISALTKNINKLFRELELFNSTIESYSDIFEKIKKNNIIFDFKIIEQEKIERDQVSYFYYDISLSFLVDNEIQSFYLWRDLEDTKKLISKSSLVNAIILNIEEYISFKDVIHSLQMSISCFKNIEMYFSEIDYERSDFFQNSMFIINHFKSLVNQQVIETDSDQLYGYITLRKIDYSKTIQIVYSSQFRKGYLQIKLPNLQEVFNLFSKNQLNLNLNYHNNFTNIVAYNPYLKNLGFYVECDKKKLTSYIDYEYFFKQEIVRINQHIFNQFNISDKHINVELKKNRKIMFEQIDYSNISLKFFNIRIEDINIIPEKINIHKNIINF